MRLLTTSLLVATMTLTACGAVRDSRINPFNWFGQSRSEPVQTQTRKETNPLIPERRESLFSSARRGAKVYNGTPIDQVTGLVIERVPGGAIVRATGIAGFDNVYDVRLIPTTDEAEPDENGVLTYRFEGVLPKNQSRQTSARVRTVTAGVRLTDQDLSKIRAVRVEGLRNAQTTSRR